MVERSNASSPHALRARCWIGVVDLRGNPTVRPVLVTGRRPSVQMVDRDGARLTRTTPRGPNAEKPAWSPDGEWIAFAARRKGAGYDLYVVDPDGSGLQRLTRTNADEFSPSWVRRS